MKSPTPMTTQGPTPTPWTWRETSGAGLQIFGPVDMTEFVEWRHHAGKPMNIFTMTEPQPIQMLATERWVQFAPRGWEEMQKANAALIVLAVNSHARLKAVLEAAERVTAMRTTGDWLDRNETRNRVDALKVLCTEARSALNQEGSRKETS